VLSGNRVKAIDATRGFAMFAVCMSHFGADILSGHRYVAYALMDAGLIATPLFLILSGVVVGYLSSTTRQPASDIRARLIDRGFFLIVVGHTIIAACSTASAVERHTWTSSLFHSLYITDVIGLALCIAAFSPPPRQENMEWLFIRSLGLYLISWLMAMSNQMLPTVLQLPAMVLFGAQNTLGTTIDYETPIAPYVALVLTGQAVGKFLSPRLTTSASQLMLGKYFLKIAACAISLALVIKVGWSATKPHTGGAFMNAVSMTLSPLQKLPPGPTYLLFYGGAGVGVSGLILIAVAQKTLTWFISALALVGRASFFVFVLQFLIFWVIVPKFGQPMLARGWPLSFALSIAFIWLSAAAWDRMKGNQWLTLGLRRSAYVKATESRLYSTANQKNSSNKGLSA
jgi:uncharacterized membrane protein